MSDLIDYRKIASEYFKKELLPDEVVHHIDGNHDNNNPDNLVIMKKSQHSRVHAVFNFENWQKQRASILCNSCLYVALYEDDNEVRRYETLYCMMDDLYHGFKKEKRVVDILYKNAKTWKEENNHDCYENKHMEVVHV